MPKILVQEFEETPSNRNDARGCRDYAVSFQEKTIFIQERHGSLSNIGDSTFTALLLHHPYRFVRTTLYSIARHLYNLFLPIGYPATVGPGYGHYQLYDSIQGLCSYLRGVVSSAHVLQAAGVGNENATAWGAAVTWALKDGMGLLGGLVFSSVAAPLFDAYVKEFRFFADISNNIGLTLDMLAPVLPISFLWISAASTLCKTMCGMSSGATKGSITQHFAMAGNLADLHAKEQTQETLMSLVGMALGIGLARYFQRLEEEESTESDDDVWKIQWTVFVALTMLHFWANYQAVQGLRLRTLNRQRAIHALKHLVSKLAQNVVSSDGTSSNGTTVDSMAKLVQTNVPRPQDVQESLAASTYHMLLPNRFSRIVLGARLVDLMAACQSTTSVQDLWDEFADENYVLAVTDKGQIWVSLLTTATECTQLQAFLHALLVQECQNDSDLDGSVLVRQTHAVVRELFREATTSQDGDLLLWQQLEEQGWELHCLYLGFSRRRSRWSVGKSD